MIRLLLIFVIFFSGFTFADQTKAWTDHMLFLLDEEKNAINAEDFKTYYETNHVPLIESLFPTLQGYKRTYLLESNMLNDALPLESEGGQTPFDVITELTFDDEEGLNQFFAKGADEEVVEAIRQDESNFLNGEKTIMYRVD